MPNEETLIHFAEVYVSNEFSSEKLTNKEIAKRFEITTATFYDWRKRAAEHISRALDDYRKALRMPAYNALKYLLDPKNGRPDVNAVKIALQLNDELIERKETGINLRQRTFVVPSFVDAKGIAANGSDTNK